jgi:hypothetical protein
MLDLTEINTILGHQLLIARAAQKDSLNWWENGSPTPSGQYFLERLFSININTTGRRQALEPAKVRHQAAFGSVNSSLDLFRLDQTAAIELSLQRANLFNLPLRFNLSKL